MKVDGDHYEKSELTKQSIRLIPEESVKVQNGRLVSTSSRPWLKLVPSQSLSRHRWVRLRYSTSLTDNPVRPLIRFRTKSSEHIEVMNGAVCGFAEWLGCVPKGTTDIAISPTNRPGAFSFKIDGIEAQSWAGLALRGLARHPYITLVAIGARLIGGRDVARNWLIAANGPTPVRDYQDWANRNVRSPDLQAFDAQPASSSAVTIRLMASLNAATAEDIEVTLKSLQSQAHENWTLYLADRDLDGDLGSRLSDPRVQVINPDASVLAFSDADLCAMVTLGDTLPALSLAQVAAATIREPDVNVVYGDEDTELPTGTLQEPVFRPDWSPILEETRPYLGFATFVRFGALKADLRSRSDLFQNEAYSKAAFRVPPASIKHVRRILYRRRNQNSLSPRPLATKVTSSGRTERITVVIPTRDRSHLLSQCIDGLDNRTNFSAVEIVIVDNGSTDRRAIDLLDSLRLRPGFKILSRPGPFNYSGLCNEGANEATSPYLVFLNNDISMSDPEWLNALMKWATRPDVGAVGAKLLYPTGRSRNRLQHAAVVMGLFGLASHRYHNSQGDEPGYLNRLTVPHEVSAVTGACLAVAREKFQAVGGFNEVSLPIDMNDVDLCLKLGTRGWRTIWTPEAVLYHHEAASRGKTLNYVDRYSVEREYMLAEWMDVIRDDPYFHPAFSLYSRTIQLS